jgi:hypothetical protein
LREKACFTPKRHSLSLALAHDLVSKLLMIEQPALTTQSLGKAQKDICKGASLLVERNVPRSYSYPNGEVLWKSGASNNKGFPLSMLSRKANFSKGSLTSRRLDISRLSEALHKPRCRCLSIWPSQ